MRRRDLVLLIGAASVRPFVSRAQKTTTPVIGFLDFGLPSAYPGRPVACGTTQANPSAARSSPSTKVSINRAGLSAAA